MSRRQETGIAFKLLLLPRVSHSAGCDCSGGLIQVWGAKGFVVACPISGDCEVPAQRLAVAAIGLVRVWVESTQ